MAMIIPLSPPILLVLSQVLSFKSSPRAEESIDEYAFYRYFAHKTVYLIRSCADARRFEIFSKGGLAVCRTCTSWSRLVRGVRFAWYTTEVIRSLDIGILIYVTIDRALPPSDPLSGLCRFHRSPTLVCDFPPSLNLLRVHILFPSKVGRH